TGTRPNCQEFLDLYHAIDDLHLWLEIEEPELAAYLSACWYTVTEPGWLAQQYSTALSSEAEREQWAGQRRDALDAQWHGLSEYAAYWWLSRQPGWRHILAVLNNRARHRARYRHGLARFRLLNVISRTVNSYLHDKESGWK